MPERLPSKPGWYRDPDNPRLLRHWDGSAWGDAHRNAPAWYLATELFLADENADRSSEGPAHPNELRERVTSVGAWSRDWLPWRPRQLDSGWPRSGPGYLPGRSGPPGSAPTARLSPGRRPLLAVVCLLVVAVAVVISSVAFITPYEIRRVLPAAQSPLSPRLTQLADRQCEAVLPAERAAFATQAVPQSLAASAAQMDHLRTRLSSLAYNSADGGRFIEWLSALSHLVHDQRQYASALQSPASVSPLGAAKAAPAPTIDVSVWRDRALLDAQNADYFSDGIALGGACKLDLTTST